MLKLYDNLVPSSASELRCRCSARPLTLSAPVQNLQLRLTRVELEAFSSGKMSQFNPDLPIDEQAELLPYDDQWEFPKERLMLGEALFGCPPSPALLF